MQIISFRIKKKKLHELHHFCYPGNKAPNPHLSVYNTETIIHKPTEQTKRLLSPPYNYLYNILLNSLYLKCLQNIICCMFEFVSCFMLYALSRQIPNS